MKTQDRRENQVHCQHMTFDELSTSSMEPEKEEYLWDTHDNCPDGSTSDGDDTDSLALVIKQTVQYYLSEPRL